MLRNFYLYPKEALWKFYELSLKNIMFVSWEKDVRPGQNVSAGRKGRRCLHGLDKRRWARVSVAKMEKIKESMVSAINQM